MKKFIKRAIFVAATVSAVAAYLKKVREEQLVNIDEDEKEYIPINPVKKEEPEKVPVEAEKPAEEELKAEELPVEEPAVEEPQPAEPVEEVKPEENEEPVQGIETEVENTQPLDERELNELLNSVGEKEEELNTDELLADIPDGEEKPAEEPAEKPVQEEVNPIDEIINQVIADNSEEVEPVQPENEEELNDLAQQISQQVSELDTNDPEFLYPNDEEQPEETEPIIEDLSSQFEEIQQEAVEEEPEGYPNLSEAKIKAIDHQIQAMMDIVDGSEEVDLQHLVSFSDPANLAEFTPLAESLGLRLDEVMNGNEVLLYNTEKVDREKMSAHILRLADRIAAAGGVYRGWRVAEVR